MLVHSGTYREKLHLEAKNLLLKGPGAETCFITGLNAPLDSLPLLTLDSLDARTLVTGFTFEENRLRTIRGSFGGGILNLYNSTPRIERNTFRHLSAEYGGGICLFVTDGQPRIRGNRFLDNEAGGGGGGISLFFCGGAQIDSNYFEGNRAVGINQLIGTGGAVQLYGFPHAMVMSDNVFFANAAGYAGGVAVEGGSLTLLRNTFAFNAATRHEATAGNVRIYGIQGDVLVARQNIIAYAVGSRGLQVVGIPNNSQPLVTLDCNDFWGNAKGDVVTYAATVTYGPHDFFADPSFCNPTAGQLTLGAASPCLAGNNAACGQVGALGAGCSSVVGVEETPSPPPSALRLTARASVDGSVMFRLEGASVDAPREVLLQVFDLQGRLRRELVLPLEAGSGRLVWDGRASSGAPVSSGIYFARVRTIRGAAATAFGMVR